MGERDWKKAFGRCPKEMEDCLNTVLRELPEKREDQIMRKNHRKNMVIAAAAAVLVIGGSVFAAENLGYIASSSKGNAKIKSFASIEKQVKGIRGISPEIKYVESFRNGFTYKEGEIRGTDAKKDNEDTVYHYQTVNLKYYRGEDFVSFEVSPENPVSTIGGTPVKAGDVTLYTSETVYKEVPLGYEKTEEDLEAEKKGTLMIGYSEEGTPVNEYTFRYVAWKEDGMTYSFSSLLSDVKLDELVDMAKEVLAAE